MKNLILFVLLIPFPLFAQIKVEDRKTSMNNQAYEWMVKISLDSEMRIKMMDMIVEKTKGNMEEMKKIAKAVSINPELHNIIVENYPERAINNNISIEPIGIKSDSIKIGKMGGIQPMPKK